MSGTKDLPDLNEALVFARVVELGGFTAAAARLRMPKATVSRKVRDLETRLGTRLLNRTTRRVSLTEAGSAYFELASVALRGLEDAESAVTRLQDAPRGWLRVTAPLLGATYLAGPIAEFQLRYPEIRIALELKNEIVDIVGQGIDVAIRAAPLGDSSFAVRALATVRQRLVASPGYLAAHPAPVTVADLAGHRLLALGSRAAVGKLTWTLRTRHARGEREASVAFLPTLVANDPAPLHAAAVAGLGITLVPEPYVGADLQAGTLVSVLPGWLGGPVPLSAVFASRRGMAPKVRVFVDFLVETFAALQRRIDAQSEAVAASDVSVVREARRGGRTRA